MRRASTDLSEASRNIEESVGAPSSTNPDPVVDLSVQPPADDIEAIDADHDEPESFAPPPHIAARLFMRPTNSTRRKGSAASSRRNSISSTHSRSSHGYGAAESTQSKYVAQHLRRAAVLEDRKARLADRAAHAEKVRVRAALAKSATRDTSVSEERALAAQQARERNLAEIAAACAEEVKRAKAVAESMKEKREQEIRKMRMQMEERLAEAEKRREELRSRNVAKSRGRDRGHSVLTRKPTLVEVLPEVKEVKEHDHSPMTDEAAAAKIVHWWRTTKTRQAVAEFAALHLTIDGVRGTSFERVTELLAEERVLLATARILRICGIREGDPGSTAEMVAVRTFLAAFLILGHPAQVLSNKEETAADEQVGVALSRRIPRPDLANPQLQDLVGKAKDLLISFETTLSRLNSFNNYTPPPRLLETLSEVYATFHNAFLAWKARDKDALIEVLILSFIEYDAILENVKLNTDGAVNEIYDEGIRKNQAELIVKIKRLAGPERGRRMLFAAVVKARKARKDKRTLKGDVKPRLTDQAMSADQAMGHLNTEPAVQDGTAGQTPTPPATPARSGGPSVRIALPVAVGGLGGLPDNRVVVHELAIDNEYRTSAEDYRELEEPFLKPFFERMRSTMEADDKETHFLLLIQAARMIRIKMQGLLKPGNSMYTLIGEMLDTDMAQRQFNIGSFSYEKFFSAMGSILPKLCAPARDDEVKELIDNKLSQGNYVDRLEALMGFLDVMRSDYTNYLLSIVAPQLIPSATVYEAKRFADDLEANKHDLSRAEAAWRSARTKVLAESSRRDPEGVNHPRSRPTPTKIYNQMLVDLFTQLSPVPATQLPEMFQLDVKRAVALGKMTRRIITAGAILLQCKNILKRDVRLPWKAEAARIFAVVESMERGKDAPSPDAIVDGIMAAIESGRSMPAASKAQLRGLAGKIIASSAESAKDRDADGPRDPILRLLLNRLRLHLLSRLAAASASEKVKAASTASEKLASLGLAEFVDKVREMTDEMAKVGAVDRDAHGPWWETVADKIEKEDGGSSGDMAIAAPAASGASSA